MSRFTIRELVLVTVIAAMGTVLAIEHWPARDRRQLTAKEIEVYTVALRYAIAHTGPDGLIFVSISGNDPPRQLTGKVLLPASLARVFAVKDHPTSDPSPNERVRHKQTGERGSIVSARIVQWLAEERVRVAVDSFTASDWAGGETIVLVLKNGNWVVESADEPWVS